MCFVCGCHPNPYSPLFSLRAEAELNRLTQEAYDIVPYLSLPRMLHCPLRVNRWFRVDHVTVHARRYSPRSGWSSAMGLLCGRLCQGAVLGDSNVRRLVGQPGPPVTAISISGITIQELQELIQTTHCTNPNCASDCWNDIHYICLWVGVNNLFSRQHHNFHDEISTLLTTARRQFPSATIHFLSSPTTRGGGRIQNRLLALSHAANSLGVMLPSHFIGPDRLHVNPNCSESLWVWLLNLQGFSRMSVVERVQAGHQWLRQLQPARDAGHNNDLPRSGTLESPHTPPSSLTVTFNAGGRSGLT